MRLSLVAFWTQEEGKKLRRVEEKGIDILCLYQRYSLGPLNYSMIAINND
jgi:hypothetical protein